MRIVLVAPFAANPKGTVKVRMVPIAKELTKNNHQVFIIIPPYDNPSHSGLEYKDGAIDVINIKFFDYPILRYLLTQINIIIKIFQLKPQIIYTFKPKGHSGLFTMIYIFLKKIGFFKRTKILVDMDDWEGYGGFNDYYMKHKVYPKYMLDFFDFQERYIPPRANLVTVASKMLIKRALQIGVKSKKILYIPNSFDLKKKNQRGKPDVLKKKLGLNKTRIILLYTRFFEFDVIKIIQILKKVSDFYNEEVKLLVVGKGEFNEELKLKELALREGLADSIIFVGWINFEELTDYLEIADVAIYPFEKTLLNESKCPGKLAELMSLGKAIVADDVGQISEYIIHNESGLLVDPKDPDAFGLSVINILKNDEVGKSLGINAKKRIEAHNWRDLTTGLIHEIEEWKKK